MATLANTGFKDRTRQRRIAVLLSVALALTAPTWYSTAKPTFTPPGTSILAAQGLVASCAPADCAALAPGDRRVAVAANSAFAPFLDIVPDQVGDELYISAGGVGELGGTIFANVGVGPGHEKGGWTMVYSGTTQAYVATAMGFTPNMDDYGSINITTTLGLDSGLVDFYRAYVPASTSLTIGSVDGNLCLTLVSTDTFPSEAYVVVVPSYAPPGPSPLGHRLLGSVYSVRASGAMLIADRPMSLRLYYSETTLAGADPHTLAIFAWDAYHERWDNLGGTLFSTQQYVSVATRRFTTYALMATPTWRDEFDDLSGMDPYRFTNVTWSGSLENLMFLASTPGSGSAVSKPITPTTDFAAWGSLAFTCTVDPPTTTLTVDVLSLDSSTVLTEVASGTNLADLVDPAQYPSLRLRVNMSSMVAGETPALEQWQLAWQMDGHRVYLPVVLR